MSPLHEDSDIDMILDEEVSSNTQPVARQLNFDNILVNDNLPLIDIPEQLDDGLSQVSDQNDIRVLGMDEINEEEATEMARLLFEFAGEEYEEEEEQIPLHAPLEEQEPPHTVLEPQFLTAFNEPVVTAPVTEVIPPPLPTTRPPPIPSTIYDRLNNGFGDIPLEELD
jgi:hypothetical protein